LTQYFFHLCDGDDELIDAEGQDLADASQVSAHALKEARALIAQEALSGRIMLDQYIEVRDETGTLVHRLAFRDAVQIIG